MHEDPITGVITFDNAAKLAQYVEREVQTALGETEARITFEEQKHYLELWASITKVRIRKQIPLNISAAKRLEALEGEEYLKTMIQTTRMIKADKYQPRRLQAAVSNYIGLENYIEQVDSYRLSLTDRGVFEQETKPKVNKITSL